VHPRYLDTAGLTACWREALLAQKVLTGGTRGYRRHPQLERFLPGSALAAQAGLDPRNRPDVSARRTDPDERSAAGVAAAVGAAAGGCPGDRIVAYLHGVADEADARGFAFDRSRIAGPRPAVEMMIEVTDGQLALEWAHLRAKLEDRSPDVLARWAGVGRPDPHPCFVVVPGPVAPWEAAVGLRRGAAAAPLQPSRRSPSSSA
jgi:hypothetical protein